MTIALSIETAEHGLKNLLARLQLGDTVALLGVEGTPLAILVSLKPKPDEAVDTSKWQARWDTLSQKIAQAWQSDKSAVTMLAEMRR